MGGGWSSLPRRVAGRVGRKAGRVLVSATIPRDVVDTLASEMACGVERAVDYWMFQVERALTDTRLTTLGRMNAVREVLDRYKSLTGKEELNFRRARPSA